MLTRELRILIESIKVVLLDSSVGPLKELLEESRVNWKRLEKMVVYHQIRPILNEAFNRIDFKSPISKELREFTLEQTVKNLAEVSELNFLLELLWKNDIPVLPYKGLLFLEKIYLNKQLRESGDIDIIVQPKNALRALRLLLKYGYTFKFDMEVTDEALSSMISRSQWREVSLVKKIPIGLNITLDFHWAINETFHSYDLNLEDFFRNTIKSDFLGQPAIVPNFDYLFLMLLNHNGGRGTWLRLKDLCDLIEIKKQFTKTKMPALAYQARMNSVYRTAMELLNVCFHRQNFKKLNVATVLIIKFWEKSEHVHLFIPKLKMYRIYRLVQDIRPTWFRYLNTFLKYYSVPNKGEKKRIVVFPDNYTVLNSLSKLVSYSLFRINVFFGKLFRPRN
ncbi:nucleotidyltransferase family protein [Lacihabitans soyangensis]|uniref:Nucleotidyltransferase family protein n=1 Tax=Lacihabitans soyangensis TaxID=869394 RepID=A0AAE3H5R4_9BACT|nr:nucleotidyltransferase family protein [Lacihabitans soyangensis]MCP9765694.1 hypothetical protein [Lacihabitans soyangensis]